MKMKMLIALFLASLTYAQTQPPIAVEQIAFYSGTNLQYLCVARSNQALVRTVTVSAASNASPVSFTATAHGFNYVSTGSIKPVVKITGATGMWAPINGVWTATPTSANAFTIAIDSTGFGALTGTLVVTTLAPSINALVWSIQQNYYDGSGNWLGAAWAANPGGAAATQLVAGSSAYNLACASRASYSYQ